MGQVILPSGNSVFINELQGNINFSALVADMMENDFTNSYRVSIIGALGKLAHHAHPALSQLKELSASKNTLIATAAEQAIVKIMGAKQSESELWKNKGLHPERFGAQDNRGAHHYRGGIATTSPPPKRPDVNKVIITAIESDDLAEGVRVYARCSFCEKMTFVNSYHKKFSDQIAGPDSFFCNFCLRNDYHNRLSNHVMVLTFRGLIGYYFYSYFVAPKTTSTMYVTDITDYIDTHAKIGLQNPLLRYDPETYCWFIDFSKVGKTAKKMPIETVLESIVEILAAFNLYENVKDCSPRKLYQKYYDAVMLFFKKRERVQGEKIFSPTLFGCDIPTHCPVGMKAIPVDMLQGFLPYQMADHTSREKRKW